MKKPRPKKPSYADFVTGFKKALVSEDSPEIQLFWGESPYLVQKAAEAFKAKVRESEGEKYQSIEASEVTEDFIFQVFNEVSLFDSKGYYLIRRVEQAARFKKLLSGLESSHTNNRVMLTAEGGKKPTPIIKEVERLGGLVVPCFPPNRGELPKVVSGLCKKFKINLSHEAVGYLLESLGDDLFLIENELKKLSFCLGQGDGPHGIKDISPHIGVLKEEHVFALTDKLLARDYGSAQILLEDLLARGESPVALLGIIARHCRNSIYYKSLANGYQNLEKPRLPFDVVKRYKGNAKGIDLKTLLRTLSSCQQADMALKTQGATSDKLVLSQVMSQFS